MNVAAAVTGRPESVERDALFLRFRSKLEVNEAFSRRLVSFRANRSLPGFGWLKYKEGFSTELVGYLLDAAGAGAASGRAPFRVLDPFSGSGTTVLTANERGHSGTGIELMPVGRHVTKAIVAASEVEPGEVRRLIGRLRSLFAGGPAAGSGGDGYRHLRITRGAFSEQSEREIALMRSFLGRMRRPSLREILTMACLSVLEEVSYTRKDGQYLRWDRRSGRPTAKLDKGPVPAFSDALLSLLERVAEEIPRVRGRFDRDRLEIVDGSCLHGLGRLESGSMDVVITSPPYANRYDYTRTYALELAFLDHGEDEVKELRQALLSATVENRSKVEELRKIYASRGGNVFEAAMESYGRQAALGEAVDQLERAKRAGELSNNNVINLVRNYCFEMALVVHELARVVAPGGHVFIVNDNVQYHGEEVPIDLILSSIAEDAGLLVRRIWALPRGKGNASQQMGRFGRRELRKGVYWWTKGGAAPV